MDGDLRTDEQSLSQLLKNPNAVILKFVSRDHITGCVYLEKQGNALYLGMLGVSPATQAQGIGKKLLNAAKKFAGHQGCQSIVMTVISLRHELIQWYERHGYKKNGETKPFLEMTGLEKHANSWNLLCSKRSCADIRKSLRTPSAK